MTCPTNNDTRKDIFNDAPTDSICPLAKADVRRREKFDFFVDDAIATPSFAVGFEEDYRSLVARRDRSKNFRNPIHVDVRNIAVDVQSVRGGFTSTSRVED